MWVAMTWKGAAGKTAPDCSLSFPLYLSQGQTRVGRLSHLRWNCIMGELPDKSKPCAWGQRCLPLLTLKCYCTIYKADPLCPPRGISPYVRTSPEDTFVAGTFKQVSYCISLVRLCVFLFLGEEHFMVWIDYWIISVSLRCSFNQSRTLFSPFSFNVILQLKHWWGRSWNLGAEEPLAHSHTSFSLPTGEV